MKEWERCRIMMRLAALGFEGKRYNSKKIHLILHSDLLVHDDSFLLRMPCSLFFSRSHSFQFVIFPGLLDHICLPVAHKRNFSTSVIPSLLCLAGLVTPQTEKKKKKRTDISCSIYRQMVKWFLTGVNAGLFKRLLFGLLFTISFTLQPPTLFSLVC